METDPLSTTFAALADPTRRAILARLALGEASVTELAEPFRMSMPAVSKHLRVLERAGLISRSREAQWRPRRLEAAPLREVADWVESYRRHWSERLDRLDDYLFELQKEMGLGQKHSESPASGPQSAGPEREQPPAGDVRPQKEKKHARSQRSQPRRQS
ncbi:ArsR/SmtB family transcription factor [Paracidobacterium acidisoli]|uniref:ArsR family transcriptional regulator n=1 Tax=Paracidobacterium acidisoli TaxID=2303751 RepID=A0A372IKH5_9BACT|nr:metalloregulator ArsR/SmtB family transcription factor [Paracidobacterium acidisoli]MBT9332791.1 metalloregulator ArsR/SmtB family transcription factor [Paracidobacterium acidisoli]